MSPLPRAAPIETQIAPATRPSSRAAVPRATMVSVAGDGRREHSRRPRHADSGTRSDRGESRDRGEVRAYRASSAIASRGVTEAMVAIETATVTAAPASALPNAAPRASREGPLPVTPVTSEGPIEMRPAAEDHVLGEEPSAVGPETIAEGGADRSERRPRRGRRRGRRGGGGRARCTGWLNVNSRGFAPAGNSENGAEAGEPGGMSEPSAGSQNAFCAPLTHSLNVSFSLGKSSSLLLLPNSTAVSNCSSEDTAPVVRLLPRALTFFG